MPVKLCFHCQKPLPRLNLQRRKFCNKACMAATLRPFNADAFWARMRKQEDGCWIWTGCTYNAGYGSVGWRYKPIGKRTMIAAHRAAWMLTNGPIPEGIDVCHTCDVRLCCNPKHLWLGTAKDNMADARRKGRTFKVWEWRKQQDTP